MKNSRDRGPILVFSWMLIAGVASPDCVVAQFVKPEQNRGEVKMPGFGAGMSDGTGPSRPLRSGRVRLQPKGNLAVAITKDGTRVAAGGEAALMIWDGSTCLALGVIDRGHVETINAVAFSPDGRWLASGGPARSIQIDRGLSYAYRSEGGIINLWEVATGRRLASIDPRNAADGLKFAPNGDLIATVVVGLDLSSWLAGGDRSAGFDEIPRFDRSGSFYDQLPQSISFSDNGERAASCYGQVVFLRDAGEAARRRLFYGERPGATVAAISGDGKKVAVMGSDQSLTVWDFATMTLERELPTPDRSRVPGRPCLLAFDPTGKMIVSGGADGVVRIWQAGEDHPSRTIYGPGYPVRAVAFLESGLRFVSGGWDQPTQPNHSVSDLAFWDIAPPPRP